MLFITERRVGTDMLSCGKLGVKRGFDFTAGILGKPFYTYFWLLIFLFAQIEENAIRFLRFISPLGHTPVVSVGGVFHSMPV